MIKTIFITEASSGLGKATAKLFQAKGWHVIATMRNPEMENVLRERPYVNLLKLDITDRVAIQKTELKKRVSKKNNQKILCKL